MALNIKNERVHALAREAARRTGLSQTSALEAALEHYLERLGDPQAGIEARVERVSALLAEFDAGLTETDRDAIRTDLVNLHDADGLPR